LIEYPLSIPTRKFTGCSAARKPTFVFERATTNQVVDMGLLTKPPSRPAPFSISRLMSSPILATGLLEF
jgi:hypothetical protein